MPLRRVDFGVVLSEMTEGLAARLAGKTRVEYDLVASEDVVGFEEPEQDVGIGRVGIRDKPRPEDRSPTSSPVVMSPSFLNPPAVVLHGPCACCPKLLPVYPVLAALSPRRTVNPRLLTLYLLPVDVG